MSVNILRLKQFIVQNKVYFKSSFLYLFAGIVSSIISIVINPFLAKNLLPEDYAIMGYFSSFSLIILPLLNLGLITYYLRTYYLTSENQRPILADTILIALLFFGFIALVLSSIAFYLYWKLSNVSFPFFPYALLTFAPVYFGNFVTLLIINYRLNREAGKFARITIANAIFNALLAITLVAIFKYGATGRLLATLLATIIFGFYSFTKLFSKLQFEWGVIKNGLRFGWPLTLSAILWFFLSGVDRVMLEKINDTYTFGFYNVAIQIAGFLAIFYTAIGDTFEPDIYKAISENKRKKLLKIMGGIITINAIPNILFILFAPLIIRILTYDRYTDASSFARILVLKNISITFYYSTIKVIVGYGYTKSELVIRLIGALLCILMFRYLISRFGFYGAAWGQVISFILMAVIAVIFIVYKIKDNKFKVK